MMVRQENMVAFLATATMLWTASPSGTSAFSIQKSGPGTRTITTAATPTPIAMANVFPFSRHRPGFVFALEASSEDTTTADTGTGNGIDIMDEVDSIFKSIDTNGDGVISPEELRTHLVDKMGYTTDYTTYLFDSIDTDSDGSITLDEMKFAFYNFEALSMYMTLGMGGADVTKRDVFKTLARNQSGDFGSGASSDKLLLEDLADLVFDMIDTDRSGQISKEELRAHFDAVTSKLSDGVAATDTQSKDYVRTMFATLDADKDGDISREEVRTAFQKYDVKLLARTFGLRVYQLSE
ncbi:unnamed protein product [Pseudo-nitzschia multistriata]|uniref:EF-hand domain-containing protein n=1 Tax=Pseudo-nitzschia multistriata TaxID=183589 RepID=A0A448Z0D1_9STRA|nr:unnamed protein product [Pseudo-nitzschia multistriata]